MGYVDLHYNSQNHPKTSYPHKLINYLIKRFGLTPGAALEVGCGRGDFINEFYNAKFKCAAVDIDGRSSGLNKNIAFETVDLEKEKLPFDEGSFDVVFTKSVIEHVNNYNNFVSECKRVLKPGGTLIIMTPDWFTCHYIFYVDYTHVRPYTAQSLKMLLLSHGLHVITCGQFVQHPAVWRCPVLKLVCKFLQLFGPVRKQTYKSSFLRWSRELILLSASRKKA